MTKAKTMYRITTKRDGLRRFDRVWSGTTEITVGEELIIEEIHVLAADPMFVVEEIPIATNRPKVDDAMVLQATKEIAKRIDDADAETIASCYRPYMDGYELAREIGRLYGWDLTMQDVEELDAMDSILRKLQTEAEKKWFEENDVQPPFETGTEIKQGLITGIDQYGVARYRVKEHGCTQDGRYLIINFEDATRVS